MATITRLCGSWSLSRCRGLAVLWVLCLISCSRKDNWVEQLPMADLQLATLTDTISTSTLAKLEKPTLFIYLPKVGCSSCGSKEIDFINLLIQCSNKERITLITQLITSREQQILSQQLGVKVYRLLPPWELLFGDNTHDNGMLFQAHNEGYASDILLLDYDLKDLMRYRMRHAKLLSNSTYTPQQQTN